MPTTAPTYGNPLVGIPAALGLGFLAVLAGHSCELEAAAVSAEKAPLAPACAASCPIRGVDEGNASIAGDPEIDAFFAAAIELHERSFELDDRTRATLDAMAQSLGVDPHAEVSTVALAEKVRVHARTMIDGHVRDGLHFVHEVPRCELASHVAMRIAGACDARVETERNAPQCAGICIARASETMPCSDLCGGELFTLVARPECVVAARGQMHALVECVPPSIEARFVFHPDVDVRARERFHAWVDDLGPHYARLVAIEARADLLLRGAFGDDGMISAVDGSLRDGLLARLESGSAQPLGAACAVQELGDVQAVLVDAETRLRASANVVASLRSTFDAV